MPIIANVRVEPDISNDKYKTLIEEKLCGVYPLERERDRHYILLNKKPKEGLPLIKAEVRDEFSNLEFLYGIKKIAVREDIWPHKIVRVEKWEPDAHAHSVEYLPELGVHIGTIFHYKNKTLF